MAKLVDILAKEMDVWPDPDIKSDLVDCITQDSDREVFGWEGVEDLFYDGGNEWVGEYVSCRRPVTIELADDHTTAIVTKQQWQEAKAVLNTPATWTGEGLPPVGTVCLIHHEAWPEDEWKTIEILYISSEYVIGKGDLFLSGEQHFYPDDVILRPIKTPEQIAEEKEKKGQIDGIVAMLRIHCSPSYTIEQAAEAYYNVGYRKQF